MSSQSSISPNVFQINDDFSNRTLSSEQSRDACFFELPRKSYHQSNTPNFIPASKLFALNNSNNKKDEKIYENIFALEKKAPDLGIDYFSVHLKKENGAGGFGFIVVSSAIDSTVGYFIGSIIPGSPADLCKSLSLGDRIVAINGSVLDANFSHSEVIRIIKECATEISLIVSSLKTNEGSNKCKETADFENSRNNSNDIYQGIELYRGTRGFGFSIRGGAEFEKMPLFVYRIADGGPAERDSRLSVGDQIIQINGINTTEMTHNQALDTIKNGNHHVIRLLVKKNCCTSSFLSASNTIHCPQQFHPSPKPQVINESSKNCLPAF